MFLGLFVCLSAKLWSDFDEIFLTCDAWPKDQMSLLGRKALYFTRDVFLFLFLSPWDLRTPSADCRETLPHDRNLCALYNACSKIQGALSHINWGPKTCKICANFIQLHTLTANVSRTDSHIENRKSKWSTTTHPKFDSRKVGELWSINKKVICINVDAPKATVRVLCKLTQIHSPGGVARAAFTPPKIVSTVGLAAPAGLMLGSYF